MIADWKMTSLGDCITLLNGYAFKSKYFTDNKNDLVLIKGSNLGKGVVLWGSSKYWDRRDEEKFSKFILKPNDLLLAMDRPWVSGGLKYAIIKVEDPKSLLVQRIACLRSNDLIDQLFLKFVIGSEGFSLYIKAIQGGVGVPHISPSQIKGYEFPLPPLSLQRKIATILSTYDDLIENNLKRIKLLEEKAKLTYEEWFVRMRFPGWETMLIDEVSGLPEGWENVKCYDVMYVLSGGTPKTVTREYWNGEIQFFTPKDACSSAYTNGTEKKLTQAGLDKCNSKLYPKNTVFITARGTVGKVNLASEGMAMNQSCYALKGKNDVSQLFLYNSIISIVQSFKSAASGGVFDTIIVDTFKFLPFILPTKFLIDHYTDFVSPIYESCLNIQNQNQLLKEARDILLPRLMTGMIDVEKIKFDKKKMGLKI